MSPPFARLAKQVPFLAGRLGICAQELDICAAGYMRSWMYALSDTLHRGHYPKTHRGYVLQKGPAMVGRPADSSLMPPSPVDSIRPSPAHFTPIRLERNKPNKCPYPNVIQIALADTDKSRPDGSRWYPILALKRDQNEHLIHPLADPAWPPWPFPTVRNDRLLPSFPREHAIHRRPPLCSCTHVFSTLLTLSQWYPHKAHLPMP